MARSAPVAFVLPWFSRTDYPLMRRVLGSERMPASFEEWLARAEAICHQVQTQGGIVEWIPVKALTFHRWCMITGSPPDEQALCEFVIPRGDVERQVLLEHMTGGRSRDRLSPSRTVH